MRSKLVLGLAAICASCLSAPAEDAAGSGVVVLTRFPAKCLVVGDLEASGAVPMLDEHLPAGIEAQLKAEAARLGADGVVVTHITSTASAAVSADGAGSSRKRRIEAGNDFTVVKASAIRFRD